MAATKFKDLVVSTGTYTDNQGQQKNRYENVGGLFKTDDGKIFALVKRHINFAGFPSREGSDSVIVSVFDLPDRAASGATPAPRTAAPAAATAPAAPANLDDDIPF